MKLEYIKQTVSETEKWYFVLDGISLLLVAITGVTVSAVLIWFNQFVSCKNRIKRALITGGVLYGLNITIFNFFIPLVFNFDVTDLLIRTFVEICFVTVGTLFLPVNQNTI